MFNRAEVVDKEFVRRVLERHFPEGRSMTKFQESGLTPEEAVELFESQVVSRQLDLVQREMKARGESFYTIGSSGHEGNVVLGKLLTLEDMAFLHYRSGAFMVQRSKQLPGSSAIFDTLLGSAASVEEPIAGGRHKVWGSVELNVPPQTSTIGSHLPKAVGVALSIARSHDLKLQRRRLSRRAIVMCNFGDASANHSTAQGAFNTAGWITRQQIKLPLLFVCEDNGLGISVPTPSGWVADSFSRRAGLEYFRADGLNLFDVYRQSQKAVRYVRRLRRPAFLHIDTVRLLGHAGSDVESLYRKQHEIEEMESQDPLLHSARLLVENDILTAPQVVSLYQSNGDRVRRIADEVARRPRLEKIEEVAATITANTHAGPTPNLPEVEERAATFGKEWSRINSPQHMAKLLNWSLQDILLRFPNTLVFGEDVGQKGGVYHVTDGLTKKFGARRVFNSLLDEQAILGTAIGMAHNGFLPIPEIQFLAYVHNAEDQIRGEAATLAFFSQGQYTNPMVIRIAGLGYQKGFGGHFHNDNSLSVFRDVPGLILAVPANGEDAVKMLRACVRKAHEEGRVVVFIEPIARYMTKDLYEEGDKLWSFPYPPIEEEIAVGELGQHGDGDDFAIITYGNGVYYSLQAMQAFEETSGSTGRLIDLRWLSEIRFETLLQKLEGVGRVLVVDECRKKGSTSEEVVTLLVESMSQLPKIKVHAAADCYIPLGPGAASGLPSKESILSALVELTEEGVRA